MKKTFLILLLVFFGTAVYASIQNYQVPSQIPLGKNLIISGQLDDNSTGTICSFLIYDTNTGLLIKRLTDEKTNEGFFSTDYFVTSEPMLFRENIYTATTICSGDQADANFTLTQRESLDNQVLGEALFARDNFVWIFLGVFLIIGLIILFAVAWRAWK